MRKRLNSLSRHHGDVPGSQLYSVVSDQKIGKVEGNIFFYCHLSEILIFPHANRIRLVFALTVQKKHLNILHSRHCAVSGIQMITMNLNLFQHSCDITNAENAKQQNGQEALKLDSIKDGWGH